MTRRILLAMLDKKKGLETDAMLNDDNYPGLDVASAFIEFQSQTYGGDDYIGFKAAEKLYDDVANAPIRLLKTHLPAWLAPEQIFKPESTQKVVLVTRNPKDCLISFYHMTKNDKDNGDMRDVDFETFYKMFIGNELIYGNWIDWHNGWIKALKNSSSKNLSKNLHIVYYEDLIQNYDKTVKNLGKFIGLDEKDIEIEKLKKVSDFKTMQKTIKPPTIKNFIRKLIHL